MWFDSFLTTEELQEICRKDVKDSINRILKSETDGSYLVEASNGCEAINTLRDNGLGLGVIEARQEREGLFRCKTWNRKNEPPKPKHRYQVCQNLHETCLTQVAVLDIQGGSEHAEER